MYFVSFAAGCQIEHGEEHQGMYMGGRASDQGMYMEGRVSGYVYGGRVLGCGVH